METNNCRRNSEVTISPDIKSLDDKYGLKFKQKNSFETPVLLAN